MSKQEKQVQVLVTTTATFPESEIGSVDRIVQEAIADALGKARLSKRRYKIVLQSVGCYGSRESEAGRVKSYYQEAREDAADTAENFLDEIVEMLVDKGEASDDLMNEYPNGDSYHHENHTDKSYGLAEAAEVISNLHEWIETDKGLWQTLEPEEAISAQAAYTYGNAVYAMFDRLIEEINDEYQALDFDETEAEERRDRLAELEALDKRTRDEYNELRALRKTAHADLEEVVQQAKADKIKAMVEAKIEEWKT